ncbi:hypothetical protein MRB53_004539 [Persea americana]|uniref:Uncharacterized protein n=1 Tax=Persea americana TaxID=3435 RepID=A0ACC2MAH5_PERAE|nr:hypothetical protein MRB53_004539 [Persea americana]
MKMNCRVRVKELLNMKTKIEIKTGKLKRGRALPGGSIKKKKIFIEDQTDLPTYLQQIERRCISDNYGQIQLTDMNCCFALLSRKNDPDPQDEYGYSSAKNLKLFSYDELRVATRNFHASNKIGRGGFGTVCKGTLKNGTEVAVKMLSAESKQGVHEFLTEIDTISSVKHPNLVELIGCCVQGKNRILVYEYVENNSLDRALFGSNSQQIILDWSRRSAIIMGTARGLAFLHDELVPPIVHRDIKASNILLGKNFLPKIGDFGLAKLFPDNVTHLSTRVAGTMSSSKSTWAGEQKFLLEMAWQLHEKGRLLELVDPRVGPYPEEEALRFMKIALFCTQAAAQRRPLMTQVVAMLSKNARLHEKLLTAPGIIQDMVEILGSKGAKKSSSRTPRGSSNESSSANSSTLPFSSPTSFTEMDPR